MPVFETPLKVLMMPQWPLFIKQILKECWTPQNRYATSINCCAWLSIKQFVISTVSAHQKAQKNCWQSQIWLNDWAQLHARIQLSVMAHCLAELILRRISKNWTNSRYLFGWFIILNVMSDLVANFSTLRSRNEPERWVAVFTPGREMRLGTSDAQVLYFRQHAVDNIALDTLLRYSMM